MLIIDCFDNSDLGEEESLKTKLQQKENITEECLVLLAFFFLIFFFFFSPFLLPESPLKTSCFSEWAMALHGKRVLRVFSNDQIKVSRNFRQCISCSLVTEDSVRKQTKVLQYQQWSCHSLHLKLFSSRHQNYGLLFCVLEFLEIVLFFIETASNFH